MSVNWRDTTAICMLIVLTPLVALSVPATVDLKEMESTAQVCVESGNFVESHLLSHQYCYLND